MALRALLVGCGLSLLLAAGADTRGVRAQEPGGRVTEARERWQDPGVFDVGRVRPRAFFIPRAAGDPEGGPAGDSEGGPMVTSMGGGSSFFLSLNGEWRFHWAPRPAQAPADFQDPGLDDSAWDLLPVPSNWELLGYGSVAYGDSGIPPGPAGFVDPAANPVGTFRHWFDLPSEWAGLGVALHFGSVGSAVSVWVNGEEVGYSQGSKVPTEFDITSHLRPGRNLIAVRVWRWSDGSYLEDVGPLRLSGIDRDVFLVATPPTHLEDLFVRAGLDRAYRDGLLEMELKLANDGASESSTRIRVELLDPAGAAVRTWTDEVPLGGGATRTVGFRDSIPGIAHWTAETPSLYTLRLHLESSDGPAQVVDQRIGFRTVEVTDGLLRVNGVPITLTGVNREEPGPIPGRPVSGASLRRDLVLMKSLNINAVRTSHYPSDPRWYDLADEVGMYVVDEAFLDSGGTGFHPDSTLAGKREWLPAHMDRLTRMIERDKNHPSVILWSLGSEAGDGPVFQIMYEWAGDRDPTRPVVYEMADLREHTDVIFPTSATVESLESYAAGPRERPLVLSAYASAGSDPESSLAELWTTIRAHDQLQGAFFPGPELNARAPEVQRLYQPVGVTRAPGSANQLEVHNRHDFLTLSHLEMTWTLLRNGAEVSSGPGPDLSAVAAGERLLVDLPDPTVQPVPGSNTRLRITFRLRQDRGGLPAGHVVAWQELPW